MSLVSSLRHAWDAFFPKNEIKRQPGAWQMGPVSTTRPDRARFRIHSERTIIASIYTRLAIDVSAIRIEHCRVDENGIYKEKVKGSGLNECFNVEANIDQGGRHFRQDIALTLFNAGVAAVVPVETTLNPETTGSWDAKQMRVGEIVQWYPEHVMVRLYNQRTGMHEDITLPKQMVGIIENPFYSVMNEPNSTLQRLIRKLTLLDNVDEIASQGKLDIIIQLPYVVKSETRKNQAEKRVAEIQTQLKDSAYGIAYTDGTEKITQLNRSVENNLLTQIQYLEEKLFSELGLTPEIMNGTADDVVMLNYMNRTIEPIMDAITEAMNRKFLTKTARTQGQAIMYFESPFKLLPLSQLADIADVLSRNQIVTPNELRPVLGLKPSDQPQADQLVNSNMPLDDQVTGEGDNEELEEADEIDEEERELDRVMAELDL